SSNGRLGCISCHDPHAEPTPKEKTEYFRQRCLACHEKVTPCSVSPTVRREQNRDDNCVACHMPRSKTQIAHVAASDHRIPRRPPQTDASPKPLLSPGADGPPLIAFHHDLLDPADPEVGRALGIALMQLPTMQYFAESAKKRLAIQALPLLEQAP